MTKVARITLFIINFILLLIIFFLTTGKIFPSSEYSIVIFSSLLMLSFVTLFLEHFFTTPTDVLASTIAILLLISPLHDRLSKFGSWYWIFFTYNVVMFLMSLFALLLLDSKLSAQAFQNRISLILKNISISLGNGRFLFFALFFLTLLFYVDSQSEEFLVLAGYASIILLVDPKKFLISSWKSQSKNTQDVGEIIGVQSRNTFLAKLFAVRVPVRRFDIVTFRYSMDHSGKIFKGMIVDNFLLNEQQWIKILAIDDLLTGVNLESKATVKTANIVCKVEDCAIPEILKVFVGVVIEQSSIGKLRFDYAGRVTVTEGCMLEANVAEKKVFYQVTQGLTAVESLEQKNEAGFIVGEAVQLGIWDERRLVFEKYGWVPEINTPLFLASSAPDYEISPTEAEVGSIPGTNYPVLLDLSQTVTYHTAILGITGSGKSVFCRDLIRKITAQGTKVICVDFTNEYRHKFPDLAPENIVTKDAQTAMFKAIDVISSELEKFPNQQNKVLIEKNSTILRDGFHSAVEEFMVSDKCLSLFELPDVSNTTGILEYTKWFFRGLFSIAREESNFGKKVCVVLEEAHTVIPEWNFIGVDERKAQSLVNSISQIALQGRKYNVGFIIVAQRTANVSKTILTQCNTVIAFQQFDKTSSDFLLNYMGAEMVEAISGLKFKQAIAVGKAFRSGIPVIFEVPTITEPE